MKIAIPHWQGRVSPVFDVATNLVVIELAEGGEVARQEVLLTATDPVKRAQQVAQLPAELLICGAISWPLEIALRSAGVEVIAQTCGQLDEVVRCFQQGDLAKGALRMPGCCGRRRFRGRSGHGQAQQNQGQSQTQSRRPCGRRNRKRA